MHLHWGFVLLNGTPVDAETFRRLIAGPERSESIKFPATVGPGVDLFDVEGIPESLGNVDGCPFSCAAWDRSPPKGVRP